MGVLGLTPFLQKTCPEVVKYLPDRLRALSGKRIVIDGTLITQRFHFAPMPQQYRHVLAWYRLAKHLKDNDVEAICVFDGRQRTLAKEREIERRRQDRMVTAARGGFENERHYRLRRLSKSLEAWCQSDSDEFKRELDALALQMKNWKPPVGSASLELPPVIETHRDPSISTGMSAVDDTLRPLDIRVPELLIAYDSSGELELVESLRDVMPLPSTATHVPPGHRSLPSSEKMVEHSGSPTQVSQLYREYCQSILRLASLSVFPEYLSRDIPVTTPEEEIEAFKAEIVMSKSQQGLWLDEAELWEQLADCARTGSMPESVTSLAETLEAKSGMLYESYKRRTRPPSSQTYQESREILRAMGVPCIEPSGPFEAEALAASLVINGRADYVASEDTDVLVYDVPLIRNIASRDGPLVLISGPDVRSVLDLDRARFIDFALLLGTDFSQRIKKVGPMRALKFIRKHGSIERVIEHEKQFPPRMPPEEYLTQVGLARLVFQTLPPTPDAADLQQEGGSHEEAKAVLEKYDLGHYALDDGEFCSETLSGNYFADDPSAI